MPFKYIILLAFILVSGCATSPSYNHTPKNTNWPRSILVLPPTNSSIEVNAPYIYLSTISRPLAEKGYYVFPVSVIDTFLKENGLPTPAEMNAIPLDKIHEYIGPDAVLYINIDNWGQKFQVLSSVTVVSAQLKLVDTLTGKLLWQTKVHGSQSSDSGNNGLLGAIVSAVVTQITDSINDQTPAVARTANYSAINRRNSLPNGPYRISAQNK